MLSAATEAIIQQKYEQLLPYLNEASIRAWAAAEALSWGHGGITSVNLIASTKTSTGLKANAAFDKGKYSTGIQVSEEQLNSILH